MSFFTVYCMVGAAIALPPMSDKKMLQAVHKNAGLPPVLTEVVMFVGFIYCVMIWPKLAHDIIRAGKAKKAALCFMGLCLIMIGVMGLYFGFCWYFSSDIRAQIHGRALVEHDCKMIINNVELKARCATPAGEYQHIPGAGDYEEFVDKNK